MQEQRNDDHDQQDRDEEVDQDEINRIGPVDGNNHDDVNNEHVNGIDIGHQNEHMNDGGRNDPENRNDEVQEQRNDDHDQQDRDEEVDQDEINRIGPVDGNNHDDVNNEPVNGIDIGHQNEHNIMNDGGRNNPENRNDEVQEQRINDHDHQDRNEEVDQRIARPRGRASLSSVELLRRERQRLSDHERDVPSWRVESQPFKKRVREHRKAFVDTTKKIHHCQDPDLKEIFIKVIAASVNNRQAVNDENLVNQWNGEFTSEDIINLLKKVKSDKSSNLYEEIRDKHSAEHFHITAEEIVHWTDTKNPTEIFAALRKHLPGFFASSRQTDKFKKQSKETMAYLKPTKTATGLSISPWRLRNCLNYLYHWLGTEEWWRFFIDGSAMGREQVTLIGLSNINSSSLLHGIQWNSPKEVWLTNLFFLQDSRYNLESNLGSRGGALSNFIDLMQENGHQIFLSADSKCIDAVYGGGLSPTSTDKWNVYMYGDEASKARFNTCTGRRSDLHLQIDREHPEKMFNIPLQNVGIDPNHMISRITEKIIKLLVRDIHQIPSWIFNERRGNYTRSSALAHLVYNISSRNVHRGKGGLFTLQFEKDQLKDFTLNTSTAEVILAPAEDFGSTSNVHEVLENVLPSDVPYRRAKKSIPHSLTEFLEIDPEISHKEIIQLLWRYIWKMYKMLSAEPFRLKEGAIDGSTQEGDYEFGYTEEDIKSYCNLADKFHRLFLFLYDFKDLTSYMMKMIDVAPCMMRQLPYHSLMRTCTESGEHKHYENSGIFYHHTPRGGGKYHPSVLLLIFERQWRILCHRIKHECPSDIHTSFQNHIQETVQADKQDGNDDHTNAEDGDGITNRDTESLPCLSGKRFILSGKLTPSHQVLTNQINRLGGMIYPNDKKLPDERLNLQDWFVVTTQAELDRPAKDVKHVILQAFRRKWTFISADYITECTLHSEDRGIQNFVLSTTALQEAPPQSMQALRTIMPANGTNQG